MRKNQTSLTAAGIALARAIESEKPDGERLCYDPYARQFVPGWMYHLFGFFIRTGYAEMRGPGVTGFLMGRERYIDDVLLECLESHLEQLVVLGAGFDARPYRFDLAQRRVTVFEVDHPATQAGKIAKVRKIFGGLPEHVRYVPVDFNKQKLKERLLESGYDPSLVTLFIWQGVTMYLEAGAVDATLDFVRKNSAPGSIIVFDYVYQEVLQGVQKNKEISNMRRYRFMSGEDLSFGIPRGKGTAFLEERGYRQVKDANAEDLRQAYFTGIQVGRKVAGGYGILIGKV